MSGKSTVEVLREARELISDPKRWTRFTYARNGSGEAVDPCAPDASCFCALGALANTLGVTFPEGTEPHAVLSKVVPYSVPDVNDGPDAVFDKKPRYAPVRHKKVLAAFDKAIALAEDRS